MTDSVGDGGVVGHEVPAGSRSRSAQEKGNRGEPKRWEAMAIWANSRDRNSTLSYSVEFMSQAVSFHGMP